MTTVISWVSYAIFSIVLNHFLSDETTISLANVFSWISAVAFAFITNKIWVFGSKSWEYHIWRSELLKFIFSRLATGIVELVAVPLIFIIGINQTVLGVKGMGAKIIISVVVVILNYVFSKFFVF